MDSKPNKQNIQYLQQDVIEVLGHVKELMERASKVNAGDNYGKKYQDFQAEIKEAARNVEELELRMAIVAPMKAGKSTIVNGIIGQELLPSRNAAMTTIPTEIIFNPQLNEPVLTLSEENMAIFAATSKVLQQKIQLLEHNGQLKDHEARYPHLVELIQVIKNTVELPLKSETTGREEIIEVLAILNDIVRLCSILVPSTDPLAKLTEAPSIATPFWRSHKNQQAEQLGNLVIVDTPGPNEAEENLRLTAVVTNELRKSSIVLIVLDFTQLNNKAAEDVKKQVQPVIELLGKDSLYVLVNKVDQRRKGDMTPEEVKDFVFADLELSNTSETNKVFEVSAIQAFCATKFLLELQQHPDVELQEMKTAPALAQEALGARWETKFQRATKEELQEEAEFLWEDSGFAPFLEQAINALMTSAAPRCIMSALHLSRNRMLTLRDDLNLRSNAIAQDEEKLLLEVGALEADLKRLELCRLKLKEVEKIKTKLQQNLNETLELLKQEAQVSIEDYFIEEDYERGDWVKKMDMRARELFLTNIGNFEIFPQWISRKIKTSVEYKTSGLIEFNSEAGAGYFASQAVNWAKQRAENLLLAVQKNTEQEIEKARQGLMKFLAKETKPIIEQARKRLNQAFEVQLSPPSIELEGQNSIEFVEAQVRSKTKEVTEGKKERYRPWYLLWMVEQERVVEITRTETYYTISMEDLVKQINESIEINIDHLKGAIAKYLDEDFQHRIDIYFEALDAYLRNYKNSLQQAQKTQKLSLEEKKKLVWEMRALFTETSKKIERTELLNKRTELLMPDKIIE